jgi:hypothetical protein
MHWNLGGFITIGAGIYVLLATFRVVPLSSNPQANERWLQKFGPAMKVLCPLLILFGLGELFGLFR